MKNVKIILDRENNKTEELDRIVEINYKGVNVTYTEVYYVDFEVDENSGKINKDKRVRHYTKNQLERNLKSLKNAYLISLGAASPTEIAAFRNRYNIPASVLSLILGFSKNTISNIENEGITSLPSGRLIKICLDDKSTIQQYLLMCNSIDDEKKRDISKRLLEESY